MATRLDAAGYRTGLFGKYLNEYSGTGIPPGWDRWFAHTGFHRYYDYKINDDGTVRHFGSSKAAYETDVMANRTKTFIGTRPHLPCAPSISLTESGPRTPPPITSKTFPTSPPRYDSCRGSAVSKGRR